MLSCGMLTSLAASMAAFSRMLPLGSPPPFLAATVISRRIFEKSLPRWTSALPFLRLICDHRECPDIALTSFVRECGLEPLDALQAPLAAAGPPPPPAPAPPPPRPRGAGRPRPAPGARGGGRAGRRGGPRRAAPPAPPAPPPPPPPP